MDFDKITETLLKNGYSEHFVDGQRFLKSRDERVIIAEHIKEFTIYVFRYGKLFCARNFDNLEKANIFLEGWGFKKIKLD